MRSLFWKAAMLTTVAAGMACNVLAQTASPAPTQQNLTAESDPPPAPDAGITKAGSSASTPKLQPTVAEELDALKSRIEQLENEVREAKASALADSQDTAALKAAEKELLAGNGAAMVPTAAAPSSSAVSASQPSSSQTAEPAPAAAQAPPEIERRPPRRVSLSREIGLG